MSAVLRNEKLITSAIEAGFGRDSTTKWESYSIDVPK
jgi:hypothetical protein